MSRSKLLGVIFLADGLGPDRHTTLSPNRPCRTSPVFALARTAHVTGTIEIQLLFEKEQLKMLGLFPSNFEIRKDDR